MIRRVTNQASAVPPIRQRRASNDNATGATSLGDLERSLARLVQKHGVHRVRGWPLRDLARQIGCRMRTMQALRVRFLQGLAAGD